LRLPKIAITNESAKAVRKIFLTTLFILAASFAGSAENLNFVKGYVDGEILVKYKDGTASPVALNANRQIGATVIQEFSEIGWQHIKLPENLTVEQALINYRNFAGVEFAQPNYIYSVALTPNDPQYGSLYGMTKIGAPTAWNTTTGNSSTVVAVIDTGVRYTHEDIAANMWRNPGEIPNNGIDDDGNGFVDDVYGWNFAYGNNDPNDDYDHGTHCAGTIGAVGNNSKGVAGVNWTVRVMALKIHDSSGNSTAAKIIQAYSYVRMMKLRGVNIRVTSNSYGGAPEAAGYDQATKDAIDAAGDVDILNAFAAGNAAANNDTTPFYPASYDSPSILAVAASDTNDNRASFSCYGATSVDLAAPGVSILSLTRASDSSYGTKSGTSMATPHAAGAAALLAAANPSLSAASLKASLMNSVNQLPQWNGIVKSNGRLNIANAIQNPTVCNFNLQNSSQNVPTAGGNFSVNVAAATNCDFSAISQNNWITVTSGNPGSGNAAVNFTVAANAGSSRTGTIKIAGQNFTINQNGTTSTTNAAISLDFDGDGKADYSVLNAVNNQLVWHNFGGSSGYRFVQFGANGDLPVPADYDGDGKVDVAVWRAGTPSYFYILRSGDNVFQAFAWGAAGDAPQTDVDFDGDRRADFAVTRRVNNQLFWYVWRSTGGFFVAQYGLATDKPVRGDFDGDGKTDLAVYRPTAGTPANSFLILRSSDNNFVGTQFGQTPDDAVVSGDFDGDGKTDLAVFRQSNGTWYWLNSSTGQLKATQFGINGDLPVPADYDGDGKTDLAIYRVNQTNGAGIFYVNRTSSGIAAFYWGQNVAAVPANNFSINF
jgi:thermitase